MFYEEGNALTLLDLKDPHDLNITKKTPQGTFNNGSPNVIIGHRV